MSASVVINQVRRGFYLDSVALMRISAEISTLTGIQDASLMIGSESNKRLLDEAGLLSEEGRSAGPNDLIVALRASDEGAVPAALQMLATLLEGASRPAGIASAWRPRTLDAGIAQLPGANFALVSVPGEFAAREAVAALRRGLHVMLFSDNVPIEQERMLKQIAQARGLLVMGPDCGTALLAGIPLGFANEVPRGGIGAISASGTGLQEFSVLVARGGGGISHGIGVGGRDLNDEVGGISTLMAIDALEADHATESIAILSKPPDPASAHTVLKRLAGCRKPVTVCFLGIAQDTTFPKNVTFVATLKLAAESVLGRKVGEDPSAALQRVVRGRALSKERRWIRGLYCGGSLCAEAQVLFRAAGLPFQTNAPIPGAQRLERGTQQLHTLVDLGADEYTAGRPHPMIEPAIRSEVLERTLREPDAAVILLDVVLGHGAHPDPAGAVAEVLASAGERPLVVASVCGTEADPQDYNQQVRKLEEAGVIVTSSNADATELAVRLVRSLR